MGASIRYFLSLHQLSHVGVSRKFRGQILLHSVVKKSDKARVYTICSRSDIFKSYGSFKKRVSLVVFLPSSITEAPLSVSSAVRRGLASEHGLLFESIRERWIIYDSYAMTHCRTTNNSAYGLLNPCCLVFLWNVSVNKGMCFCIRGCTVLWLTRSYSSSWSVIFSRNISNVRQCTVVSRISPNPSLTRYCFVLPGQ